MSSSKQSDKTKAESSKRERFEAAGKFPVKKVVIAVVVIAVVAVSVGLGLRFRSESAEVGGPVVSQGGADYSGASVEMSALSPTVTDSGTLTLSVAEVKDKKIGGLVYSRKTPMPADYALIQNNGLPVLSYVAPSGRIVVAISLCEPCRSYDFHIEGSDLVCNRCFTRWDLDTLEGVAGGCLDYPPQELRTTLQGDLVQIDQSQLESWVPRI